MIVKIRFKDSERELFVDIQWNILFLKQIACNQFSLDSEKYALFLNHRKLNEDDKASSCGITENCYIDLFRHETKNRFFVYCYVCEVISPARLCFTCESCSNSNFTPSSISAATRTAIGRCNVGRCGSTSARVSFLCLACPDHQPAVFLEQIRRNLESSPCIACYADDIEILVNFCVEHQHVLCLECFKCYAKEYLDNGLFHLVEDIGFTLPCPAGCTNSFISDPHHFRILGAEFYERYKDFSASKYTYARDCIFCPQCGQLWDASNSVQRSGTGDTCGEQPRWFSCDPPAGCGCVFCSTCGWVFKCSTSSSTCLCGDCPSERHTNRTGFTGLIRTWCKGFSSSAEYQNRLAIAKLCRPCPRCKTPTEKTGGCNHIHCTICSCDWCWICCDLWSGDCQSLHWL